MRKFVPSTPYATVSGRALHAFFTAEILKDYLDILKAYNLYELDPDLWYPSQTVMDCLRTLSEQVPDSRVLTLLGTQIHKHASLPNLTSIEHALSMLDTIHSMSHRDISLDEHISAIVMGPRYVVASNGTPYPDDLVYGYFWGLMGRFVDPTKSVIIAYDDPSAFNSDGEMKYHIQWGEE